MRPGTPGFIGARLREAREARGLTAIVLADLTNVTRAAISQYENGHQSPSPEIMREISRALNVPLQRFLRPMVVRNRGAIFYRCMNSATKRARARAERQYDWLRDIVEFLEKYVRFPEVRYPTSEVPAEPVRIENETIDELATDARRFLGLGDGPISNVTWLLENNGAVLSRIELGAATLDAFSEWHWEDKRPFVILAADKESAARTKFDAAHELGHLLLHRRINPALLNQNACFKLVEAQANRFASAFLLPASSFGSEFYAPSLDAFRSLKQRWGVSISAMIMRSSQLGLINEEQQKRLWMNMARRKWKAKEPLDDILEPEAPRFLKRCLETLLDRRIMTPQELSFQLGIPARDIERLAGLPPGRLGVTNPPVDLIGEPESTDDSTGQMILRFPTS